MAHHRRFLPCATLVLCLTVLVTCFLLDARQAVAQDSRDGLRARSALGLRAVPIGLNLINEGGWRWSLFDSDSVLLEETYFEAGATTQITPSNAWAGAYIEALPLAVLELRASAQSLNYFGTFGYLHLTDDANASSWEVDSVSDDIGAGQPASGLMLEAQATPRAKVGNVVFLAPTQLRHIDMGVETTYYESTFDWLLEPTDTYWLTTPTLGYVLEIPEHDSWVLASFRWEHSETLGTDLSRDMAALLGLWKMPWSPSADSIMEMAVIGGWWVDHPNRQNTPYLAGQLSIEWGAR